MDLVRLMNRFSCEFHHINYPLTRSDQVEVLCLYRGSSTVCEAVEMLYMGRPAQGPRWQYAEFSFPIGRNIASACFG